MPVIHDYCEQGTDEWKRLRLGIPTASRFKDVLAKGTGVTRKAYMMQLAAETLTGEIAESYSNAAMEWGTATEPKARDTYQFITGNDVNQVSFITHDTIAAGYSPDGLVLDVGTIEIKCPKTTTHIETVLSGKVPSEHKPQIQGGLWIAEREWLDFISFDPRIGSEKCFFQIRVYRDTEYIKELEKEVIRFNDELAEIINKMR